MRTRLRLALIGLAFPTLVAAQGAATTVSVTATAVPAPAAASMSERYARAEQMLPWNTSRLVYGDVVQPQWYKDGTRFWFRNKTKNGADFLFVDGVTNTVRPLFDNARLAAAITLATDTSYDGNKLPFQTFRFAKDNEDERNIEFRASKKRITCDITAYTCVAGDTIPSEVPFVLSPDKKWEAFVMKYNVYVRPRHGGDTTQLTTDGVQGWGYGMGDPTPQQLLAPRLAPRRPQIQWAPDSRHLLVARQDTRGVLTMPYISYTSQRPRAFSQPYALPGDSIIPVPGAHILDRETKGNVRLDIPVKVAQLTTNNSLRDSVWTTGSDKVKLVGITRASKSAYLWQFDAASGKATLLAHDTTKTFVEVAPPTDPSSWYVTKDGQDVIWWSERDGWGHLWRMGPDGKVKNQITSGPWQVGKVVNVDEKLKQIWFTARGRESDHFVYYQALYRVNFDGSMLTLLTPEDAYHDVDVSPSGKVLIDRMSRIEKPTETVLRDLSTGKILRTIAKADVSQLAALGWKPAQVFSAKARDGVTDIYGVMYLPPNLDPSKKYPIISNIYPGPQVGSVGQWTFKGGGEPFSLTELGFIVVQIDHIGTPGRSKAFHDNYYGNFIDNGLPDHVTVIKQLAAEHPYIDLDRVGIFGHSGGGFASTDAMLRFPDFFKVAVSGSGNHDNRSYNIYWAEKYQGLLKRDTLRKGEDNFTHSANKSYAANLKGKLLLMHGDMDDNVHPAMTVQLIDELEKANKAYDLVWAPNRPHSLNEPYFIRRRWDYFVTWLLHQTPPDNYKMTPPEGSLAPGDGLTPDDPDEPMR
ncbi:MAG: DPP IV N-terminal domain-containing protein [Gemmatimonadetes bacterium]|nr:DPP IV N-terminal domain-containing protein [Gemmatimonadota bacterium]